MEPTEAKPVRMTREGLYNEPNRPFKRRGFWKEPDTIKVLRDYSDGFVSEGDAALVLECRVVDLVWHRNRLFHGKKAAAKEPVFSET